MTACNIPFASMLGRTMLGLALAVGAPAAFAQSDATSVFPTIDTCIDAALQQQDGLLIGWDIKNPKDNIVQLDVLAPDDKIWTMQCSNGKVSTPEKKVGQKKYKMLSSRVKVPEKSGRFTAVGAYPIAEVRKMEYDTTWKGRPYYVYQMKTNDGRDATVEVNAETGQVDRSKSERKD
jgi:hypothetical protein